MRMVPELVAECPCTTCTNSGTNMIAPNIAADCSVLAADEIVNTRLVNSRGLIDRLPGAHLPENEGQPGDRREDPRADDLPRQPRIGGAGPGEPEQHGDRRRDEQRRPLVVEAMLAQSDVAGQRDQTEGDGHDAHRQIDVEHPAPAEVVGDPAAEQRADDHRQAEDAHQDAHELGALSGREDVADDRLRDRHHGAGAQALEGAEGDEGGHAVRLAAQGRAHDEDAHAQGVEALAAVGVGELAPDRHGSGRRQQVAGGHPHVVLEAVQAADDHRQGGADDRLVEGRQQHAEHHAGEDEADAATAERVAPRLAIGGGVAVGGRLVFGGGGYRAAVRLGQLSPLRRAAAGDAERAR